MDGSIEEAVNEGVRILLPAGTTYESLSFRYNEGAEAIQAPVKTGDHLASVEVWHNNVCLAQAELFALHDVKVRGTVDAETIPQETGDRDMTALFVVLIIVGLLLVLLFGKRFIFRLIHNHKVRRHRKNRRRSR